MKKKILFICPYFPPYGSGGAERTSLLHAEILIKNGYEVSIITPSYGDKYETNNSFEIIRFDIGKKIKLGEQISPRIFYNPITQNKLKKKILESFNSDDLKCIHVQHHFLLRGAALAAEKLDVPLISHIRDTGLFCSLGGCCLIYEKPDKIPYLKNPIKHHIWCYFRNWIKFQEINNLFNFSYGFIKSFIPLTVFLNNRSHLKNSKKIIFASKNLKKIYKQTLEKKYYVILEYVYAVAKKKVNIKIKRNYIIDEIKKKNNSIILYTGKLSKGKGFEVLLKAFEIVSSKMRKTKLVVCGNGNENNIYKNKNIIFLGFISQSELTYIYKTCDLVVIPSIWPEPLGWSTIDAAISKKPVVASKIGGIPEAVINKQTGFLVARNDCKAMAKAIIYILKNKNLSKTLGENANKFIYKKFGSESILKKLKKIYDNL